MKGFSAAQIRDLMADIELERSRLERLNLDVQRVQQEIQRDPDRAGLFYENLALKLHNFYTGCERIFRLVVRNLYGYELDSEHIARLVEKYPAVWLQVKQDLDEFMEWLNHLVDTLEQDEA